MRKKLVKIVEKWSAIVAALLGLVAAVTAFLNLEWALFFLALGFSFAVGYLFLNLRRLRQGLNSNAQQVRRVPRQAPPVTQASSMEPNAAVLRQLHLSTLEEVRLLHAEMMATLRQEPKTDAEVL